MTESARNFSHQRARNQRRCSAVRMKFDAPEEDLVLLWFVAVCFGFAAAAASGNNDISVFVGGFQLH
jgi:uncharacterized membrane protein YccC